MWKVVVSLLIASGNPKDDGGFGGVVYVGKCAAVTVQVGAWPKYTRTNACGARAPGFCSTQAAA